MLNASLRAGGRCVQVTHWSVDLSSMSGYHIFIKFKELTN